APGIDDFSLFIDVILFGAADDHDDVFAVVTLEGFGDFQVAAGRIGADAVLVLLECREEVLDVVVELSGSRVDAEGVPRARGPYSAECNRDDADRQENFSHHTRGISRSGTKGR